MNSRVSIAVFVFALAGLMTVPTTPVAAHHSAPPFEVAFPQEISETTFSNTWGVPRPGGRRHKGTDLMAPRLTEVYAVADGVVDQIRYNGSAGRSVRISHGAGWTSHYVHLNNDTPGTDDGDAPWTMTVAPRIEEGREVKKGQVIGWVGDSGNAENTAPHTHFELRLNGRSINPYFILVEAFERDMIEAERLAGPLRDLGDYSIE